jgi:hypothetical protein
LTKDYGANKMVFEHIAPVWTVEQLNMLTILLELYMKCSVLRYTDFKKVYDSLNQVYVWRTAWTRRAPE